MIKIYRVKWNERNEITEGDRFCPYGLMRKRKRNVERRKHRIKEVRAKVEKHNHKYLFNTIDDDGSRFGQNITAKLKRKRRKG
jgi:hypothetical protein